MANIGYFRYHAAGINHQEDNPVLDYHGYHVVFTGCLDYHEAGVHRSPWIPCTTPKGPQCHGMQFNANICCLPLPVSKLEVVSSLLPKSGALFCGTTFVDPLIFRCGYGCVGCGCLRMRVVCVGVRCQVASSSTKHVFAGGTANKAHPTVCVPTCV